MYKIIIPEQWRTLAIIKAVEGLEKALNSNKQDGIVLPVGFEIIEVN